VQGKALNHRPHKDDADFGPGLRVAATSTWEMQRDFEEWIRITNAPERAKPLFTVMLTLAKAGLQAGIDLRFDGKTVLFKHRWLLVTAQKDQ
jgi:hypothetical protein